MQKVILRRCENYDDIQRIASIIQSGMLELDFKPFGNTMVKINEVAAFPKHKIFKYASTPPEFLDAAIRALKSDAIDKSEMKSLYLGGKCGITIPTRFSLKTGGQWQVLKKHGLKARCFDEEREVEVRLLNGVMHKTMRIPLTLYNTDTIISLPRLKANPFSTITAAIKLNIGMLDDKERLKHHHHSLDEKIVDILEVGMPSFIAVDAIVAGEKNMLEPLPYPIGAIVMGSNPVAVDSVLCHMLGINPMEVKHARIAFERGYGPICLDDILLAGDISLGELKEKAKNFRTDTDTIDKMQSKIKFYVGPSEKGGYCFGGCPGAFKEACGIIEGLQPDLHEEVMPMHIIFGNYQGEITAADNEPIFLLGKCTRFEGAINGNYAVLDSGMTRRQMSKAAGYENMRRIEKCPISVAENIILLALHGKAENPYLDKDVIVPFAYNLIVSKLNRFFHRHVLS